MNKTILAAVVCVLVSALAFPSPAASALPDSFPRKANYYLEWHLTPREADELARWDLVILDMENQVSNPDLIRRLRAKNPDIIVLAYITPQEILQNAAASASVLRRQLSAGIAPEWYLTDSRGARLSFWPGTHMLNITSQAPLAGGRNFQDYLAAFVSGTVLGSGLWDGVFYDNAWEGLRFTLPGGDVDTDRDGMPDSPGSIDKIWQNGLRALYEKTRQRAGSADIILGNGWTDAYARELNGMMIESFSAADWAPNMNRYRKNFESSIQPRVNIINANTGNQGAPTDHRAVRFGLGSALLEDGFFSFDYGNERHGQLWWYDEYSVNLGSPVGGALSAEGRKAYSPGVWRRDFEHGLAVINSTGETKTVELFGEYEKIRGVQDAKVNDGSIVSETAVANYDGLVLLKTFASLDDVVFTNGDFARFFRPTGERVRNGFFAFEEKHKGGDQIAHVDLDGNGKRDRLEITGNRVVAWRDDGQPFMKEYPYSAGYAGGLRLAIGDLLFGDGIPEIYVAPESGYALPIKIYNRHGRQMRQDWYPFGAPYRGGYTLAVGQTGAGGEERLLIGAGPPRSAAVSVYDQELSLVAEWPAFSASFRGALSVASGDLDGDGRDEIVVGAGPGGAPTIKVFDETGRALFDPFTAYTSLANPGVEVRVSDVDFDGRMDIIGLSRDTGL